MKHSKQITMFVSLLLVIALAFGATMSAQSGTWVSGITIQNLSDSEAANVTITFYWAEGEAQAGQVAATVTATIEAGKARTWYIPTHVTDLPDDFVGSAVVTSDVPVSANVNTQVPTSHGTSVEDPNRIGTSIGVIDPATTLYFTQVEKAFYNYNSYVAVQNTSGTAANVTIRYYSRTDGAEITAALETVSVSAYSTYIFRQAENSNLPNNWVGSAIVTSSQPLAGIANMFNDGSTADTAAFMSYNAFTSGATTVYVPRIVRNYYGFEGGLTVQNVGSAATDLTITYTFNGIEHVQSITNVQPGSSKVLFMPNVVELDGVMGSGSAVVESSSQPIVATVNIDYRGYVGYLANSEGRGATYNAFLEGGATDTVFFSQVASRYYGYCGGIQIQNVGDSATTITATFSATGYTDVTVTATLQVGESKQWYAPNVAVSGSDPYLQWNGSVVVTADEGDLIVGVANNSVRADTDARFGVNYGDNYSEYNGVNK